MNKSWMNGSCVMKAMENGLMSSCNLLRKVENLLMRHIIVHTFVV